MRRDLRCTVFEKRFWSWPFIARWRWGTGLYSIGRGSTVCLGGLLLPNRGFGTSLRLFLAGGGRSKEVRDLGRRILTFAYKSFAAGVDVHVDIRLPDGLSADWAIYHSKGRNALAD